MTACIQMREKAQGAKRGSRVQRLLHDEYFWVGVAVLGALVALIMLGAVFGDAGTGQEWIHRHLEQGTWNL
jgi:hypothetical protein